MELNVTVPGDKKTKKEPVQVSDEVFACDYKETLVHQVVNAFLSGSRAGTKAQKNRSAVSGGGKKPWRQKGTGRARAGTNRSPLWRAGGVVFAAQPRDYSQKVNKKMYRGAMRSILSELVRQERLTIVETIDIEAPKTKMFAKALKELDVSNVLIINDTVEEKLYLASRNIPHVDVRDVQGLDPLCLIKHDRVIITVLALKQLEEWLG